MPCQGHGTSPRPARASAPPLLVYESRTLRIGRSVWVFPDPDVADESALLADPPRYAGRCIYYGYRVTRRRWGYRSRYHLRYPDRFFAFVAGFGAVAAGVWRGASWAVAVGTILIALGVLHYLAIRAMREG